MKLMFMGEPPSVGELPKGEPFRRSESTMLPGEKARSRRWLSSEPSATLLMWPTGFGRYLRCCRAAGAIMPYALGRLMAMLLDDSGLLPAISDSSSSSSLLKALVPGSEEPSDSLLPLTSA